MFKSQEASTTFLALIDNGFVNIVFFLREFILCGCIDFIMEKFSLEYSCVCLRERVFNVMQIIEWILKNLKLQNLCCSANSIRFTLVKLLHGNGFKIRQMHVIKYHHHLWLVNHDHGQKRWLDSSLRKTGVRKQDTPRTKIPDILDNYC